MPVSCSEWPALLLTATDVLNSRARVLGTGPDLPSWALRQGVGKRLPSLRTGWGHPSCRPRCPEPAVLSAVQWHCLGFGQGQACRADQGCGAGGSDLTQCGGVSHRGPCALRPLGRQFPLRCVCCSVSVWGGQSQRLLSLAPGGLWPSAWVSLGLLESGSARGPHGAPPVLGGAGAQGLWLCRADPTDRGLQDLAKPLGPGLMADEVLVCHSVPQGPRTEPVLTPQATRAHTAPGAAPPPLVHLCAPPRGRTWRAHLAAWALREMLLAAELGSGCVMCLECGQCHAG